MDDYAPLIALTGALALVGTATATWFSVATSRRMLQEERRYRARLYALQLVERWESVTHTERSQLRKRFAKQLKAHTPVPLEAFEVKDGVILDDQAETVLAFLDHLGLSLDKGVADEEILRSFFQKRCLEWSTALSRYREHQIAEREVDPWPYLTDLQKALALPTPA